LQEFEKQNLVGASFGAHVDDKGEALRIPYTLKPEEVSYAEWIETIEQS